MLMLCSCRPREGDDGGVLRRMDEETMAVQTEDGREMLNGIIDGWRGDVNMHGGSNGYKGDE